MGPIIKLVDKAYNVIKNYDKWAQGFYQFDKDKKHCEIKNGVSFCALGALQHVFKEIDLYQDIFNTQHVFDAQCILQRVSEKMFNGKSIQYINDDSSVEPHIAHQNVLKVYEEVLNKWKDRDPTEKELSVK